jgi:hypothetical protein
LATITLQVGAGASDGILYGATFISNDVVAFGQSSNNVTSNFMLFTNVTIPNGATIINAYLQYRCKTSQSGTTILSRIYGNNVDDATAPTTAAEYNGKALTTAYVDWDSVGSWTAGTWYDTPDIKTVIQEIVNRAGWASGNDILILHKDDGSTNGAVRTANPYEDGASFAPKLVIEYTTATNATVEAVAATATNEAITPSVTATQNATVAAATATVTNAAIAPAVSATQNATVTAVTATASCTAGNPTVAATQNVTITAVKAEASAAAIAPTVEGTSPDTSYYIVKALNTINAALLDPDGTLSANSNAKGVTQQAAKTYADTKLPLTGGTLTNSVFLDNAQDSPLGFNFARTLSGVKHSGSLLVGNVGTGLRHVSIVYFQDGVEKSRVVLSDAAFYPSTVKDLGSSTKPWGNAYLGGAWNGGHLVLGAYHIWVDATGDLRIKNGAPTSDTDGAVIGSQS